MDFVVTRHLQRYEYFVEAGYAKGKCILDVGCGTGYGDLVLCGAASAILAVDPQLSSLRGKALAGMSDLSESGKSCPIQFIEHPWEVLNKEVLKNKVDVVTAFEFIEHIEDPAAFINFAADVAPELFLTTPYAHKTAPTRNPEHVVEFSHKDLCSLLEARFVVQKTVYQYSTLEITESAQPRGSSLDRDHVVQMLYCTRK